MAEPLNIEYKDQKNQQRGVTLVELLVAIFILGLSTSIVFLNAPPAVQTAEREAKRFAARIKAASDEAVISGELLGLEVSPSSYSFVRFRGGEWQPVEDRILGAWELDAEISLELTFEQSSTLEANDKIISGGGSIRPSLRDEVEITRQPEIQFRPIGEDTAMTAIFSEEGKSWSVEQDRNGKVALRRHVPT